MYKRMLDRTFFILVVIIIIAACAKISTPSGGPKDRTPPVVVKTVPLYAARNFHGNKIEIIFDEYVVLDNINEKFMVSPPMKKKPRVFTRGKGVEIEFDDKLKDSTTYTFYFQDAIKDLNEGNILQNYQFVLSSGPVIDSLSVTGNIFNAFNLEVPEKTEAFLYRELADSAVKKHLPEYISRVDQDGYFRINNVRPGIYRLYGLKDLDNSKNYNSPDEEFAFMDSTVIITPEKNFIPAPPVVKDTTLEKKATVKAPKPGKKGINKSSSAANDTAKLKKPEPVPLTGEYKLFQFAAIKKAHYLAGSRREQKNLMTYVLSLPPDTMSFEFSIPGTSEKSYFTEYTRNRDTLMVWLVDSVLYSQALISTIVRFPFTDTLGVTGYKQDTVPMRFAAPRPTKGTPKIKKNAFTVENNIQSGFLKPGQTILFKSKTPFAPPDTSRIKLYEVLQTTRLKVSYSFIKDTTNSCRYFLTAKLGEKKNYLFVADSAAFSDIYNERTDSIGIKFSIKDPESYCKLTIDIKNYEGSRIIQLLDKTEKLIAENYTEKDGKTVFSLLDPGTYRVKVIYDLNRDRKWTTGDFDTHRQPEPVSYYPTEIELKPGWELNFTDDKAWDISVKNFKDQKLRQKKKGK